MSTTAVQAGLNGLRDLPTPSQKSRCVRSNSPRSACGAALRLREMSAHPRGSASGSHELHEQERFVPRTFVPPELGLLTVALTFLSQDNSGRLMSYETR